MLDWFLLMCALRVFGLPCDGPNVKIEQLDYYRKLPMRNGPAASLHGAHYQSLVKVTGLPQPLALPAYLTPADSIIQALLVLNPTQRLTVQEALRHPYISKRQ